MNGWCSRLPALAAMLLLASPMVHAAVQLMPLGPSQVTVYPDNIVALRVAVSRDNTAETRDDNCALHWSADPAVTLPAGSTPALFIPANTLQPGTTYSIQASAQCPEGSANTVFSVTVLPRPAPSGGTCSVMPTQGAALDTPFHVGTTGWQHAARTALFVRKPDGQLQALGGWINGASNQMMVTLPWFGVPSLTIECHADNGYGTQSKLSTTVQLTPPGPQYQVIAQCSPAKIAPSQPLLLRAAVQPKPGASVNNAEIQYHWSVSPATALVLPPLATLRLDGGQTARLRPDTYTFSVAAKSPAGEVTAKCQVQVEEGAPTGGNCSATWLALPGRPPQLQLRTGGWRLSSGAAPVAYQFFYQGSDRRRVMLGPKQAANTLTVRDSSPLLASGVSIGCTAYSAGGAPGQVLAPVPPPPAQQRSVQPLRSR